MNALICSTWPTKIAMDLMQDKSPLFSSHQAGRTRGFFNDSWQQASSHRLARTRVSARPTVWWIRRLVAADDVHFLLVLSRSVAHRPSTTFIVSYGCVFFSRAQILVKARCSSWANHTPESYPESYPRIIPPKNLDYERFFWGCLGLQWPQQS